MKNILLTIGLLLTYSLIAQNPNLSKENKELLREFNQQESLRKERVNAYLLSHPERKATLIDDGFNFAYIYDIINGKPIYQSTSNLEAARGTKTVDLWAGGSLNLNLDGSGMTVGVWDGGPADNTHAEFGTTSGTGSRVTIIDSQVVDGDTGSSSHATHVAGTISAKGVDPNAIGMAPNVNIKSYNWSNDEAEMITAVNDPTNPIILSNHSYGIPINQDSGQLDASFIGAYSQDARDIDNIAKNNPKYLIVWAAGNDGNVSYPGGLYPDYDKLVAELVAKNNLVVANANPSVTEQPLFSGNYELFSLAINSSSGQGPTDDLRIKPDIAADGSNLLSPTPNGSYSTFSGTSMASPNTAGTLVLLQQYYNQLYGEYMNSSTLKGLVCHTAIDDSATTGPDPIFGWGFLNARASATTIMDANNSAAVMDELTLGEGETYTFTISAEAGDKLSATMCWTDMPGQVSDGTVNDPTPRLVNDLDLRISDGSTTYLPWKLDFNPSSGFSNSKGDNNVDNIERIDIEAPTTGMYTFTVTHKGTLQGNVGGPFDPQSQDFSIIVTGNNLTLGVDENDLARSLVVYPNPSKGEFTISFESNLSSNNNNVKVDIYDLQGRLVYNNNFNNISSIFNETISLDNAKSGVYMLNISDGSRVTSHKLVIN
ncbi:S8 family serine peptidase [uncultured Winogradskyella sp.]|uniref:S8 family serine peptidase n=1 Tax=uncultured Winogradskyella sp. TaxID=395353 RepID=UPI0026204534|nr:S8 family serine peptidase [uncultured Winogradskyella sp.]